MVKRMDQSPVDSLFLKPPIKIHVLAGVAFLLCFASALQLTRGWDRYTLTGRVLIIVGVPVLWLIAVDAVQRRYKLSRASIGIRRLFFWFVLPTPEEMTIIGGRRGEAHIVDGKSGKRLLTIPREYNTRGQLVTRLREFLKDRPSAS